MKARKSEFNVGNLIGQTERTKSYYDMAIKYYDRLLNDSDKEEREKVSECKYCYYSRNIGGASCTTRDCACCGKTMHFGSTNTDSLCLDCANQHFLCKHCMGDRGMRPRRRKWPV